MEHLGLVGLPDSGHAQLFSALTGIDAPAGFETTKGVAPLPDDRVDRLAEMSKSKKRIHATFEIDFIPGLAPGGKAGEGLGSRFLGSLRDTDAVLAVVRAGDDADPAEALGALELDLVLADLASVEQRLDRQRRALKGDKTLAGGGAPPRRAPARLRRGTPPYPPSPPRPQRVPPPRPADVLHDRRRRVARLVVSGRRQGARVRRRDPLGPPARLHPRRGDRLARAPRHRLVGKGQGARQAPGRRQGVRGARRRRARDPLQRLTEEPGTNALAGA